jgi:DNA polymerase-3 subunit gamma/tau
MRDALGILDQLAAGGDKVTVDEANGLLGLIDVKYLFDLADALIRKDASGAMACIEAVVNGGKDDRRLLRDMVEHFRHVLMMKIDAKKLQGLVDYPVFYRKQLFEQAGQLTIENILKVMDIFIAAKETERLTEAPRLALELALAKAVIVLSGPQAVKAPVAPAPRVAAPAAPVARPVAAPIASKPVSLAVKPTVQATPAVRVTSVFSLTQIKERWDEMTAAVQEKKPSLGSCLLEGMPVSVVGKTLTVAFPRACAYQKESLEEIESIKIVEDAFAGVLGQELKVVLTVADGMAVRENSEELQKALDSFQGEVINEWHNEA